MVTKAYNDGKISYTVEEVAAELLKQGKNHYTASDVEKEKAAKMQLEETEKYQYRPEYKITRKHL